MVQHSPAHGRDIGDIRVGANLAPDHHDMNDDTELADAQNDARVEANTALGTGIGIGAFGAASAVLIGSVCPMCIVASPALIGYGIYKRIQCARSKENAAFADSDTDVQTLSDPLENA